MNISPLAVVRACLQAYVDKDRAAIEALIADAYHFTSPIDNAARPPALLRDLLAEQRDDGGLRLHLPGRRGRSRLHRL